MSKTNLLIDGNAIGNAHSRTNKLTYAGMEVQAIFGFIKTVRSLYERVPASEQIVLWDGRARWRFEAFPDYKKSRQEGQEKPEDAARRKAYKDQRPFIMEALTLLGVTQMIDPDGEADDLAGFLTQHTTKPTVLITGDQDWLQLVNGHTVWFDPIRDHKVSMKNFAEFTNCIDTRTFLQSKALQGDKSDEISGVGGIGETYANQLLLEHNSVEHFWAKCDSGEYTPRLKREQRLASEEGREIFQRNMKLMNLIDAAKPGPKTKITKGIYDAERFYDFCCRFGFLSIVNDFDRFTTVFRERAPT